MNNFPQNEISKLSIALSQSQSLQSAMRKAINEFLDAWHVAVVSRKVSITLPQIPDELPQTYQFDFDDTEGEWGECGQALLELVRTVTNLSDMGYPDVQGSIDVEDDNS